MAVQTRKITYFGGDFYGKHLLTGTNRGVY